MAKQKGWTNSIPVQERTFLPLRELGRYTDISYDLVRKYVKGREFLFSKFVLYSHVKHSV